MRGMTTATVPPSSRGPFLWTGDAKESRLFGTASTAMLWLAGGYLLLLALAAIAPGWLGPTDPLAIRPAEVLKPPSLAHLMGTDQFGRDVLSQLIYGTRASIIMGLVSVALGGVIGGLVGVAAGYMGRATDVVVMRLVDILMCFPGILLALVIEAALGPGLHNEIIAVAVASIPVYARVMRGQTLAIRSRHYITAARASGVRETAILARHIFPNVLAPFVVLATLGLGISVIIGSSLDFLGLGPQGGIPDWGLLLANGQNYLDTAWWISTFPGLAITLLVIAANVLGDWLRDRLDPSAR
jgi:peptide/nickel transport system permease protein